jgi:hypothetical protein
VFLAQRNHESRRITSAQSQTFSPYIGFGMVELKIKMLKINLFYLFEFGSQFLLCIYNTILNVFCQVIYLIFLILLIALVFYYTY